jgi:hypothetical protein
MLELFQAEDSAELCLSLIILTFIDFPTAVFAQFLFEFKDFNFLIGLFYQKLLRL